MQSTPNSAINTCMGDSTILVGAPMKDDAANFHNTVIFHAGAAKEINTNVHHNIVAPNREKVVCRMPKLE